MSTKEFKMQDEPFISSQRNSVEDDTQLVADEVPDAHLVHLHRAAFIAVDYRHLGDWFPNPRIAECMGKTPVETRSGKSTRQGFYYPAMRDV